MWRCTLTSLVAAVALSFCFSLLGATQARAQSIESAIMPGSVIKGHADLEEKCENCHVRFDRDAQPRLCLDCHKPVAADVRSKQGFHGRLKETNCRTCHTEHKGRDARVVMLDEKKFDHAQTDFLLRGKHQNKACNSCHQAGEKHRKAPSECVSCHRKEDKHKGALGDKCGNCHNESDWKQTRFDHSKTKFRHYRQRRADRRSHPDLEGSITKASLL